MDYRKQQYMELLDNKLDAVLKMLKATKKLELTAKGTQDEMADEADRFSTLYEQRANIIAHIQKMDEGLADLKDLDTVLAKEGSPIIDKIKAAAKELVELDKKNMAVSKELTEILRGNIKKIRTGRDINTAYVEAGGNVSGYYFDKTN